MREEWADRIAFGIVGLAAVVLVVNFILALSNPPEPEPAPEPPCSEADGACIEWPELHYPGIEWRTD